MAETKVSGIIANALEDIRTVVDANTIIGTPIETNSGTTIIPVSKVSMGIASGGVDYLPKNRDKDGAKTVKSSTPCFGGGGGTGISVTPLCFLVVDKNGKVTTLNINNPTGTNAAVSTIDSISSLLDKAPETIEKIKGLFSKKEPETALDDEELENEIEELTKELEEKAEQEQEKEDKKAAKKAAKKAK